jgi:hypothetical protein
LSVPKIKKLRADYSTGGIDSGHDNNGHNNNSGYDNSGLKPAVKEGG